jgi:hypothetical protein
MKARRKKCGIESFVKGNFQFPYRGSGGKSNYCLQPLHPGVIMMRFRENDEIRTRH